MKLSFIVINFLIVWSIYAKVPTYALSREQLIQISKQVAEKELARRRELEFGTTVQREAIRLKIALDDPRVANVRLILETFGTGINGRTALAVAKAESGLRCEAYHFNEDKAKSLDHSVFQINSVHKWRGNLADCKENIKIAFQIFKEQGWSPWVTFWNGAYKKYM